MPDQSDEDELTHALDDQTETEVTETQVDEVTEVDARGGESETSTVVVDLRKTLKESRRPGRRAKPSLTAAESECLRVIAKDGRSKRDARGLQLPLDHWSDAKIEKFLGALHSLKKRRVLELLTRIDRIVVMPGPFEKHVKPLLPGPKPRRPQGSTKKTKPRAKRRR
jgi:hypothetical protein